MTQLFNITHEVGDLSEYDSTVTDSGDLSAAQAAALASTSWGLSCVCDNGLTDNIYGDKNISPSGNYIRVRFYIDPNNLTMATNDEFYPVRVARNAGSFNLARINFRYSGSAYQVRLVAWKDDDTSDFTSLYTISDAEHYIEFNITRSSSDVASDGTAQLWIDGVSQETLTGLDNYDYMPTGVNKVRIGVVSGDTGTSGTLYLDEIVCNDDGGEIGQATTTSTSTTTTTSTSTSTSTSTTSSSTSTSTTTSTSTSTTSSSTSTTTTTSISSSTSTTTSSSTSTSTTSTSTTTTTSTSTSTTSSSTSTTTSTSTSTSTSTTSSSTSTTTTTSTSSSTSTSTSTTSSSTSTTTTTSTTSSSTSTTTSTSTSTSTTTTLNPSTGGLAFGEQNPTEGETAVSWQTWSDGAAGTPTIIGDSDWGKIELILNAQGRSAVYDFGDGASRTLTLTENRYGAGQGTATLQLRGQAAVFSQDDGAPAWDDYSTPVNQTWQYVQVRAIKSS